MVDYKLTLFSFIIAILLVSMVMAIDCTSPARPQLPHGFRGYAKYGSSVLTSETVVATLAGNTFTTTTDSNGRYVLDISRCDDSSTTLSITFTVCTRAANETATFSAGGGPTEQNLTISSACPTAAAVVTGGGGGGGTTGAGAAAVAPSATSQTISTGAVAAGGTASAEFTAADIVVTDIKINVKQAVTASSITVVNQGSDKGIATTAITAAEASGNIAVYAYLKITVGKISNTNIEKATIQFQVPKTAGYDPTTIELRRYDSSKKTWISLPTGLVSQDSDNYYFEAETTEFSIFAIVGKRTSTMMELLDMVRAFYAGTSPYTMMELLDIIRAFYGG